MIMFLISITQPQGPTMATNLGGRLSLPRIRRHPGENLETLSLLSSPTLTVSLKIIYTSYFLNVKHKLLLFPHLYCILNTSCRYILIYTLNKFYLWKNKSLDECLSILSYFLLPPPNSRLYPVITKKSLILFPLFGVRTFF